MLLSPIFSVQMFVKDDSCYSLLFSQENAGGKMEEDKRKEYLRDAYYYLACTYASQDRYPEAKAMHEANMEEFQRYVLLMCILGGGGRDQCPHPPLNTTHTSACLPKDNGRLKFHPLGLCLVCSFINMLRDTA